MQCSSYVCRQANGLPTDFHRDAQTINYSDTITQYIAVVNMLFSVCEVGAGDEQEARDKADMYLKNFNSIPIPDEYEVECLDEE